jgi:hypothetical protein
VRAGATAGDLPVWVVSENVLKGGAINSGLVAVELVRRRWLTRRR